LDNDIHEANEKNRYDEFFSVLGERQLADYKGADEAAHRGQRVKRAAHPVKHRPYGAPELRLLPTGWPSCCAMQTARSARLL